VPWGVGEYRERRPASSRGYFGSGRMPFGTTRPLDSRRSTFRSCRFL
jgi:hypothetical protein